MKQAGGMKMNRKQMEYFIEVYRCGNIQTAADHLYVARQGLSRAMRSLE
ncbi:MAG: LysR family transcriptional regulator, partial [Selenomonas massiliensis]